MKKIMYIFVVALLTFTLISINNTNTVYAWGQSDSESDWDCIDIDDAINFYEDRANHTVGLESSRWQALRNKAQAWKEKSCDDDSCPVGNGFTRDSLVVGGSVVHDYHGLDVCKRTKDGDYVFCIDPEKRSSLCQASSGSWNNASDPMAQIFAAWEQSTKSDEMYLAAQILVWQQVGYTGIVPGYSEKWAHNTLMDNLYNSDQWQNEDVDFRDNVVKVSIGDSISVPDKEGNLHRGYWSLNNPANTSTSKSGDSAVSTINDPYPLSRTIAASSSKDNPELTKGSLAGTYRTYSIAGGKYQPQAYINGKPFEWTTHEASSFLMATRTGNVQISKMDEFGDPGVAGNKFSIYLDPSNPNYGTSCDAGDGLFQTENGITVFETGKVYTSNGSGGVNITNGTASYAVLNGLLPIGDYWLKEVEVTNEYELSDELIAFTASESDTAIVTFENIMRTVTFEVFKNDVEEPYRMINNAEFTVYDVTGHWKAGESHDVENMYFIKTLKSVDLRKMFVNTDTEIQSLYGDYPMRFELAHYDNGTIDADGIFTATNKSGLVMANVYGGSYADLWCKYPSGKDVYLNDSFNPYDVNIFTDSECNNSLAIDTIVTIANTVDPSVIGEYSVIYEITTTSGVKYTVERPVEVIEDNRPIYDPINDKWLDPISGIEVDPLPSTADEIYKFYTSSDDTSLPEGYNGKLLRQIPIYVAEDDNTFSTLDTWTDLGVKMFRGQTGHKYIQVTQKKLHNFPYKNQSVDFYLDKTLSIKVMNYTSDDYGIIDLTGITTPLENLTTNISMQATEYIDLAGEAIEDEVLLSDFANYISTLNDAGEGKLIYLDSNGNEIDSLEYAVEHAITINNPTSGLDEDGIKIEVKPYIKSSEVDLAQPLIYFDCNGFIQSTKIYENEQGKVIAPYLKHSRKYLVAETKLPEGYDYPEGQNPLFILNTKEYAIGVDGKNTTNGNKVRRMDMVLYKSNEFRSVLLNGAVFDVYDTFEEGEDFNIIKHIKPNTDFTKQGTEYDCTTVIYEITTTSTLADYESYLTDVDYVLIDDNDDEYNSNSYKTNHTVVDPVTGDKSIEAIGKIYKVYTPDIITRKYLGRYVSGGLYLTYEDALPGATISVYSDSGKTNLVKTYHLSVSNTVKILGLPKGLYYYQLDRSLKASFKRITYEAPSGYTLDPSDETKSINNLDPTDIISSTIVYHTPTDADYEELASLPACYSELNSSMISDGMIFLPEIKYGHNLLYREIEAPTGYYYEKGDEVINVKADYGVHRVENYRTNLGFRIIRPGLRFD